MGFKIALLVCAITALFALQDPRPIPLTDDPDHEGQPAFCLNVDTPQHLHNCTCMPTMSDSDCETRKPGKETAQCKVYCRPKACGCRRSCKPT